MARKITYLAVLIILCLSFNRSSAQELMGYFRDVEVLPGYDTLIIDRYQSEWWYGVTGGANVNFFFSDLKFPKDPLKPIDSLNSLVAFPSSFGGGWFLGITGEWMPEGEKWGASLKILAFDNKAGTSETDPEKDSVRTHYATTNSFTYISVSPSARYNLSFLNGLHAIGGLDFEIITSSEMTHITKLEHTGNIDQDRILPIDPISFRLGLHLGIGYDFIVADINKRMRVLFSPFITVNGGTNIINEYGSSRNTIFTRIGLSVKFGPDNLMRDTLLFNPEYEEPPRSLASARDEVGVNFDGFESEPLDAQDLAALPEALISEEIAEAAIIESEETVARTPREPRRRYNISPGQNFKFSSPTSASTAPARELITFLDELSKYMIQNPNVTVRMVGHSDNQGTIDEQQQRSVARARQAVQYLISKGISRGRLFDRGEGALVPKGDNRTEAGRLMNRRLEITVVR